MEEALLLRGAHVRHFQVLEDRLNIPLDAGVPDRHLGEERKLPPFDVKIAVRLKNPAHRLHICIIYGDFEAEIRVLALRPECPRDAGIAGAHKPTAYLEFR